jgi:hypothetical protein
MRILTETIVRGELMTLELTEQDFCPECCGTLEVSGSGERRYLKCTSCYLVLRPRPVDGGSTS